jgi:hypothetical protein
MDAEIKRDDLLFPSFLENRRIYNLAEAWWRRLFRKLFSSADLSFHTFYNNRYVSGEKIYGGNPIFNAYFPDRHKLVRIIQEIPEPGAEPAVAAWLDSFPTSELDDARKPDPTNPELKNEPIPELVIALSLTRGTAHMAQEWLRQWIVEDLSPAEMQRAISN